MIKRNSRIGILRAFVIAVSYGAVTVNVTEIVLVPFSKNCGLTANIAGTVRPFVLLRGTAFMIKAPLRAVVEVAKAERFDRVAVNV